MGKYKLQYWLPFSFVLTILLAFAQIGNTILLSAAPVKQYAVSILVWSVVFAVVLSLAYNVSRKKNVFYRFIFLASLLFTLLLFYMDGEMQGRLFFDVQDAGNAIALLLYGTLFYGLFLLINRIDKALLQVIHKIKS